MHGIAQTRPCAEHAYVRIYIVDVSFRTAVCVYSDSLFECTVPVGTRTPHGPM